MSFYAGIPYTTDPNKARFFVKGVFNFKGVERNTHKFNPEIHTRKSLLDFYELLLENVDCKYILESEDSLGHFVSRVESFPREHHHILIKSYKMMVKDEWLGWFPMFDTEDPPEDGEEDKRFYVRPKVLYLSI